MASKRKRADREENKIQDDKDASRSSKKRQTLKILSAKEVHSGTIAKKLTKYVVYVIENDDLDYTISRRYNDFKWLRNLLLMCYPGLFVPPMPPATFIGRFEDSFIEKRRQKLERFLLRIQKSNAFVDSEVYRCFIECDDTLFVTRKEELDDNPTTTNPATATYSKHTLRHSVHSHSVSFCFWFKMVSNSDGLCIFTA